MVVQTTTPYSFLAKPEKTALVVEYVGKPLDSLRTPAMIVDRSLFAQNCARMHQKSREWGASFRAHLKTHKTAEGTKLQLVSSEDQTHAVVVSTLMEAWEVVKAGLVAEGIVNDILYGLPVAPNKIADLATLWDKLEPHGGVIRLLIDHPDQVRYLEEFERGHASSRRWSIFVKINGGQNRAGVGPKSPELASLLDVLFDSPAISVHGFYGHAGNSYGSTSLSEASNFLSSEVDMVNTAAKLAKDKLARSLNPDAHAQPFVLSVGSTPTAHAASAETKALLEKHLHGNLELHAGNYPMLDLQQQHTSLIDHGRIAQRVRATVISYYAGRGEGGSDETMVDAGAIAFSKDSGPSGSYGEVVGKPWKLSRISQEHGILTQVNEAAGRLEVGSQVDIVGQHACLIAAAYPWYYIVDPEVGGGNEVVDIWVPWKGW
ncbi:hypothetical protein BDQ12DRAFT_679050 [Crucibulum laeve]|uniref:D-serine dehydratase n=1 Tax=Crucibulum laeve TaxID=68775 RepID=A0A5C3M776_9AGAR|nr:hypothetical protein BDQ12DRAFT_679050 [Crucibulum laeve]